MTPDEIFAAFAAYDYALPEEALRAAQAMPETMAPLLLERLRAFYGDIDAAPEGEEWVELYALYLLAAFKDERVLPILREYMDRLADEGEIFELPEDGPKLFASWAFSDPFALWPFVTNRGYDDFVRVSALCAFAVLYRYDRVTPGEMLPRLRELAETVLQHGPGVDEWLWYSWGQSCIIFGLRELYPLLEEAIEKKWIDPFVSDWKEERRLMAGTTEEALEFAREEFGEPVRDVVEELRDWHCFTEEARLEDIERGPIGDVIDYEAEYDDDEGMVEDFFNTGTIVNDGPKLKPNQPYPCGSGKKYKKCCGRK